MKYDERTVVKKEDESKQAYLSNKNKNYRVLKTKWNYNTEPKQVEDKLWVLILFGKTVETLI